MRYLIANALTLAALSIASQSAQAGPSTDFSHIVSAWKSLDPQPQPARTGKIFLAQSTVPISQWYNCATNAAEWFPSSPCPLRTGRPGASSSGYQ